MGMTIKSSRKWLDFAFNDPSSLRLWPRCLDGDWSDLSALRAETLSSLGRLGARSGDTGRCRGHPLSSPVSDARCDVTLGPGVRDLWAHEANFLVPDESYQWDSFKFKMFLPRAKKKRSNVRLIWQSVIRSWNGECHKNNTNVSQQTLFVSNTTEDLMSS